MSKVNDGFLGGDMVNAQENLNHAQVADIAHHYDEAADSYDSGYSSLLNKAEDRRVVELLTSMVKGKVIDVGCGTGIVLDYLGQSICPSEYLGIDVSIKMLEKAHLKFPEYFFAQADMGKLPLPDQSQDTLVSTFGPLSYSLDPEQTLAEFSRVLKPGSWLAIMPYSLRVGHGIGVEGYSTATEPTIPKLYYTTRMLEQLLAPFENVQIHGINYIGNFIEEMTKVMPVTPLSFDHYVTLLHLDQQLAQTLPVEYARHIMVIAQKAK
jgi:ubiquinone/menaquinone biosynthesis C-methylase UbiE